MATGLEGSVDLKRVSAFLDKVLTTGDLANYNILIDNSADTTSFKATLAALQTVFLAELTAQTTINTLYRPTSEPAVTATILTLDCQNRNACIFEPTPRPITANFSYAAFSSITNTNIIQVNHTFTGTIVISFESDIQVSNPSTIGTWDGGLKELTIAAGTAQEIEFNFLWHKAEAVWDLKVGEVSL